MVSKDPSVLVSKDPSVLVSNVHLHTLGGLDWAHICRASTKVITFIDLAGHEKYLKTTIFGMTGHAPDFCMLMVGSNAGVIGMTKGAAKTYYLVA